MTFTGTVGFFLFVGAATMTQEGSTGPLFPEAVEQAQPRRQPSLVELARRTLKKRAGSLKSVRVITNADLPKLSRAKVSTSQISSLPGVHETISGEAEATDEEILPDLRAEWQQAFAEAARRVQLEVNQGAVLQLRMNNLRNAFFRETDGSRQGRIQALLQDTFRQIETNRQAQAKAREALSELQNKARAAGFTQAEIADLTGEIAQPSPEIVTSEIGNPF